MEVEGKPDRKWKNKDLLEIR